MQLLRIFNRFAHPAGILYLFDLLVPWPWSIVFWCFGPLGVVPFALGPFAMVPWAMVPYLWALGGCWASLGHRSRAPVGVVPGALPGSGQGPF